MRTIVLRRLTMLTALVGVCVVSGSVSGSGLAGSGGIADGGGESLSGGAAGDPIPLSIRITSPLGRTAFTGPLRFVARVRHGDDVTIGPVRFYLDDALVGEDAEGPAYAVEWTDDNPFVPRRLRVQVEDAAGHQATDTLTLEPLEITEEAHVTRVLIDAAVEDAQGQRVGDLTKDDFTVFEDDVPQAIDIVSAETLPTTFLLLVDSSQSMAHRMDFVWRAARRLVDRLRPQDRAMVVPFSRTLGPVTGPTTDRETVVEAIDAIVSQGGTAIADSVKAAAEQFDVRVDGQSRGIAGRRAIVLITDGYDEHSANTMASAIDAVRRARAPVYPIGIGGIAGMSIAGREMLSQLARTTGGKAAFPFREDDLPSAHERVVSDVQQRYLLTYTPANETRDGRWRTLRVSMRADRLVARATPGYFAPAPPPVRPSIEFTVRGLTREFLDLGADDLRVLEDGVPQRILAFQEAVSPVSIVLALDASGSMKDSASAVKQAARTFIESMRSQDALSVETFADRVVFACDLSRRREVSLMAVDEYATRGGTALYDALGEALDRLRPVEGRRALVLLTDGRDDNRAGDGPGSRRTLDDVRSALAGSGVTIYAIGLGASVDRPFLESLAADTGGEAYFPQDVSALAEDYQRVLESLRRRYVISYSSTNVTRNGAWRQVEIQPLRGNVVVSSEGGYFAPDK
jgi:Ca-activated chloride channel family protein